MLKGFYRTCLFVMLCCFVGAGSPSKVPGNTETGPKMTASLVPSQTNVGGIVTLTLKFRLPRGAHLAPEPPVTGLDGLQVLDLQMIPKGSPKKEGKQKKPGEPVSGEYRLRLMVNRFDSGKAGPFSLSYVEADGKEAVLKAEAIPLTVLSNLGDKPETARLKPIYGIIPTQSLMVKYRFWIIGGILLLLLGAALELWLRNRRQRASPAVLRTPPDKVAIRSLKALDAQRLFEKGRIKDFYFGFSEILRHYLEAIRGFPAAEYTLEEIARAISNKEDQELLALLRGADMVKFADTTATPAAKVNDMEAAFAYIHSTREPEMTEASAERRGGRQYAGRKSSPVQEGEGAS